MKCARNRAIPGIPESSFCLLPFPTQPWATPAPPPPGHCLPSTARPAPAITCAGTREPRGQGRSPRGLQGWVTRAAGGAAGSARPGAAPRGAAPPRPGAAPHGPRPRPERGSPAVRPGIRPGEARGCPSASTGTRPQEGGGGGWKIRGNPPLGAGAGASCAEGPLPLGPAVIAAAARLGAHPGPFPAGARAEAGEARQHPLARQPERRAEPSPGAAHGTVSPRAALAAAAPGPRALRAPGGGRRSSLPAVTALSASASRSCGWGECPAPDPGPAGEGGEGEQRGGESWMGPRGPKLQHWAATAAWKRRGGRRAGRMGELTPPAGRFSEN